jgi:hypothetical protein
MNQFHPLNIDEYCNDQFLSMQQIHPDFIMNNTQLQKKLNQQLEKFKDDK